MFALAWQYDGTSMGSGNVSANQTVRKRNGEYGLATFNDYDNLFVYARDARDQARSASCICSRGTAGNLVCDNQVNGQSTYLWFSTDYASFATRTVVHKGSQVWFSDAHFLKFGRYEVEPCLPIFWGLAGASNVHTHGVNVGPSWDVDNQLCVPYKIFGVIVGT